MTYEELKAHFGNQHRIAAALGVKQPSISLWKKNGIPQLRQMQIQLLTGGLLKVGAGATAAKD